MVRIGRIVSPLFLASRMSTRNTDRPSVRFFASSFGVVRASSSIRSEYSRAAGPDLLAVDDVAVVAVALRHGLQRGGVGAAGRLGDAERLQPQFAAGDLRQLFCLLPVAAVPQHACPWCTSGRGRRRRCSRRGGSPRGSRWPRIVSGRRRHILPGSAPRDSRPWSAHRRRLTDRPSRGRACASIRRGTGRTAWRPRRGCRHGRLAQMRSSVLGTSGRPGRPWNGDDTRACGARQTLRCHDFEGPEGSSRYFTVLVCSGRNADRQGFVAFDEA